MLFKCKKMFYVLNQIVSWCIFTALLLQLNCEYFIKHSRVTGWSERTEPNHINKSSREQLALDLGLVQ